MRWSNVIYESKSQLLFSHIKKCVLDFDLFQTNNGQYLEQIANITWPLRGALMRPDRQNFRHISETSNSNRSSSTVHDNDSKFEKCKNAWYKILHGFLPTKIILNCLLQKYLFAIPVRRQVWGDFHLPASRGKGSLSPRFQQLGQTVGHFCTRRHRKSSHLSLSGSQFILRHHAGLFAFSTRKIILIKNNF